MLYSEETVVKVDYEIKQGWDGSGRPVFSIYWHDSARYPGSVTIEETFSSAAEARCVAKYTTKAGREI